MWIERPIFFTKRIDSNRFVIRIYSNRESECIITKRLWGYFYGALCILTGYANPIQFSSNSSADLHEVCCATSCATHASDEPKKYVIIPTHVKSKTMVKLVTLRHKDRCAINNLKICWRCVCLTDVVSSGEWANSLQFDHHVNHIHALRTGVIAIVPDRDGAGRRNTRASVEPEAAS